METRTIALDFLVVNGMTAPVDQHLHDLAVKFADLELATKVNLTDYRKVLVTCEVDESGKPVRVTGIAFGNPVFDWAATRFVTPEAGASMIARIRGYLEDQGLRGRGTLIHVDEGAPKETYCPQYKEFLHQQGAERVVRLKIIV